MCLYTKYILNKKYTSTKKNNGVVPVCHDQRLKYVPVSCGKCIECRKRKQREWVVRLSEEIRVRTVKPQFVTLTINDENLEKLKGLSGTENLNEIATKALRMFLERVRKETKKSIKHWCITELGEEKGRIHLHGIMWADPNLIKEKWQYGFVYIGQFVNEKTIFYITKYMLKQNPNNKEFVGKVLCSKGIGKGYIKRAGKKHRYLGENTDETYTLRNGTKIALPEYYRRNIISDEDREKLWIQKQESGYRYIMGEKVEVDDEKTYNNILQYYQRLGKELYGDNPNDWDLEKQRKRLQRMKEYRKKAVNKRLKSVNK